MLNESPKLPVKNLTCLTSLRFFAAFAIVLQHLRGNFGVSTDFTALPLDGAVSFFFVLSGFILVHVYPKLTTYKECNRFLISRVARIWPAHIICLILTAIFVGDFTEIQTHMGYIVRFMANSLLIQSWYPDFRFIFSFNSVSWSISTEMFFYLIFPILICNFYYNGFSKLIASLLVVLMAIATLNYLGVQQYKSASDGVITSTAILYINPTVRIFEFILGMNAYIVWRHLYYDNSIASRYSNIFEVFSIIFLFAILYFYATILNFVYIYFGIYAAEWAAHSGLCFISALLIISYASGKGTISRFLSSSKFVFLGEISFSIYMCHQMILRSMKISSEYTNFVPEQYLLVLYFVFVFLFSWQLWSLEKIAKNVIMNWYDSRLRTH